MKRIVILMLLAGLGCGSKPPPLSAESKAMILKFDEHLSRHKTQTFEGLCEQIEKLHETKRITDEEHSALHKVCGPASTGQWDRAKAALDPLLKAMSSEK
jgi:hypothetical protein